MMIGGAIVGLNVTKIRFHPMVWSLGTLMMKVRGEVMRYEDRIVYGLLPVEDKVVLDLGACNGDSAKFFFDRGARKVVLVEPLKRFYPIIMSRLKGYDYELRGRKAQVSDLVGDDYDVLKCDIEGYETELIDFFPAKKPSVIEAHNPYIEELLLKRGFHIAFKFENSLTSLMKNFR